MVESVNYKCLACDAPLAFSPETGMLSCDYCGSSFTVAQVEQAMAEKQAQADAKAEKASASSSADQANTGADTPSETMKHANAATSAADPIQAFLERAPWSAPGEDNVMEYVCSSCSAQLIVDKNSAISECPYCGNQAVVPGQVSGAMKPDYVIPFETTKEDAIAALKRHYQGKPYLPNAFTDQNHLEHVQGVYVPFWLYDYSATGDAHFEGAHIRTWIDHRGDTMQETTTYACERTGTMRFERIPADGSSKMPDAHMDAIEPYDYSKMVPFSVAYLPGFAAERYDQTPEDCADRAIRRLGNSVVSQLQNTVEGYDTVALTGSNVQEGLDNVYYALLPVWMLHTKWDGQDFLFAMNGQTGKFIGDLPIDKGKMVKSFFTMLIPAAAVAAVAQYFILG